MIEVIHEHSVDMSLLPAKAVILDLGARGFQFTNHFRELGHTVHAIDIDDLQHGDYDQCAITNYTGMCGITHTDDPQGTKIGPGDSIRCYTLEDYMKLKEVEFYDLIKMDVEMSELDIIKSLHNPPAKQISIEFHLHCGQTKEEVNYIVGLLEFMYYEVFEHKLSEAHGAGYNFWSSLFILK
jgi:hypothetical protein